MTLPTPHRHISDPGHPLAAATATILMAAMALGPTAAHAQQQQQGDPPVAQQAPQQPETAPPEVPNEPQAQEPRVVPVPIGENFSDAELVLLGLTSATAVTLMFFGEEIFSELHPSLGRPAPGSIDWRFTHWVNENPIPGEQLLLAIPDKLGNPILPLGTALFYLTGTVGSALSDDFPLGDTSHEMLAFLEALSWTMSATFLLKHMVGRYRPFAEREDLGGLDFGEAPREALLSFPSGHSSVTAVTMAFAYLDFSDWLYWDVLKDWGRFARYTVGRVIPFLFAYGITGLVMYSRIYDQRHWLSDTLTGFTIGALFGNLFYLFHFDAVGNPRRANRDVQGFRADAPRLMISPSADGSGAQVGYGWTW